MLFKPLFEDLLNERFMSMYKLVLVCLSKSLIVKLWHSVCVLLCICFCVCVCLCVCVCMSVLACVCFAESVYGLNECMCYVCACVCVSQYVCCICIVKPIPMCVHVPTFKTIYVGLSNDVYTLKCMYIKSVSLLYE